MKVAIILATFILGLGFEAFGSAQGWWWSEYAVDMGVFAVFGFFLKYPPRFGAVQVSRATMIACMLIATAGELVLSAGLHLYLYRVSVLPLFVPPGHVLLFLCGIAITQARWFRLDVALGIVGCVALVVGFELAHARDFLSLGLLVLLAPCLWFGRDRALFAVMFTLALGLEFYGTALGTWAWLPKLEGLGLSLNSANPPLAAGAFYSILDLLTFLAVKSLVPPRENSGAEIMKTAA